MSIRTRRAAILLSGQYRINSVRCLLAAKPLRPFNDDSKPNESPRESLQDTARTEWSDVSSRISQSRTPSSLPRLHRHAPKESRSHRAPLRSDSRTPFVPFEAPAGQHDVVRDVLARSPTLTTPEREAFRRLKRIATVSGSGPGSSPAERKSHTVDQSARAAKSQERATHALDKILVDAARDLEADREQTQYHRHPQQESEATGRQGTTTSAKQSKGDTNSRNEYEMFVEAIRACKTDVEIWRLLRVELVGPVKALGLDKAVDIINGEHQSGSPNSSAAATAVKQPQKVKEQLKTMGPNLARLTALCAETLAKTFPRSSFIDAIIPMLREAGPSVFALAASTELYNHILAHRFEQDCDLPGIVDILDDMHKAIIDPNEDTLAIIQQILNNANRCRDGQLGPAVKSVWNMHRYRKARKRVIEYRDLFESRNSQFAAAAVPNEDIELSELEDEADLDDEAIEMQAGV